MLKTNVDKILDILQQRKEVMVSELAAVLKATPENIEKIAKLLEEEKLLTIKYKMMKPYLVYGFRERKKEKGEKKPLFAWRKQKGIKPMLQKPAPLKIEPEPAHLKIEPTPVPLKVEPEPAPLKPIAPKPLGKALTPEDMFKLSKESKEEEEKILGLFKKKEELIPIPKPALKPEEKPETRSFLSKIFKKKVKKEEVKPIPIPKPLFKPEMPKPMLKPEQPKKPFFSNLFKKKEKEERIRPIPQPVYEQGQFKPKLFKSESFFSKIFKKKEKEEAFSEPKPLFKPVEKPKPIFKPMEEPKKIFFSKLFKKKEKKETDLEEIKEAIKKAKGIRLEMKPIKPILLKPRESLRPVELKPWKIEIDSEDDTEKEIDNLIKEIKKTKDRNLIKRNYKKTLALYSKIRDMDDKVQYHQKLQDLYNELTK